ncbi:hypothetical protein GQR58_029367 [Nymphon striatum]|nr:hypothetical protein GQR58_029367 [Nymphon striatum]
MISPLASAKGLPISAVRILHSWNPVLRPHVHRLGTAQFFEFEPDLEKTTFYAAEDLPEIGKGRLSLKQRAEQHHLHIRTDLGQVHAVLHENDEERANAIVLPRLASPDSTRAVRSNPVKEAIKSAVKMISAPTRKNGKTPTLMNVFRMGSKAPVFFASVVIVLLREPTYLYWIRPCGVSLGKICASLVSHRIATIHDVRWISTCAKWLFTIYELKWSPTFEAISHPVRFRGHFPLIFKEPDASFIRRTRLRRSAVHTCHPQPPRQSCQHHEVLQVRDLLFWVIDGHRCDAEHLVATSAAHRINTGEATAVLWDLKLFVAFHQLIEERQASHEAHHRHKPRLRVMRFDECVSIRKAVDLRSIVKICAVRVLMTFAKPHQRLMCPGVLVEDRNLDDAGGQTLLGGFRLTFQFLNFSHDVIGRNNIGVKADLEGGVRGADFGDAFNIGITDCGTHGQRLEERVKRHFVVHLDIDVFVASKCVSGFHIGFLTYCGLLLCLRRQCSQLFFGIRNSDTLTAATSSGFDHHRIANLMFAISISPSVFLRGPALWRLERFRSIQNRSGYRPLRRSVRRLPCRPARISRRFLPVSDATHDAQKRSSPNCRNRASLSEISILQLRKTLRNELLFIGQIFLHVQIRQDASNFPIVAAQIFSRLQCNCYWTTLNQVLSHHRWLNSVEENSTLMNPMEHAKIEKMNCRSRILSDLFWEAMQNEAAQFMGIVMEPFHVNQRAGWFQCRLCPCQPPRARWRPRTSDSLRRKVLHARPGLRAGLPPSQCRRTH